MESKSVIKNGCSIQAIFYNNPDQYPPIINSVRLLAQAGYQVDILCREYGEGLDVAYPAEAQVQRLDTRAGSSWQEYVGFVVQVLRRADKDASLFVGHDMHGLLPARLLAWRYRRPLIYHCHDFNDRARTLPAGSRLVRTFEQRFARTADLVIVPDKERGQVMLEELHLRQSPPVVANAPINGFAESGAALTSALTARNKQFERILFRQGRIGPGHAIETTLRSMVSWAGQDWGFVVMGRGEPAYLDSLQQLACQLGVTDRFVILPPVSYDEVAQFTSGADLGHALYEPIHINNVHITTASNKIMEYMAAGLPLLVSNRPALRALVEEHECGVTADESSPESIATAVNILLGNPAQAQRMGCAASRAFLEKFCYERQFAPVLESFQTLTSCSKE